MFIKCYSLVSSMTPYSIMAIVLSFLFTLFMVPKWIFRAKRAKLIGKDVHKKNEEEIAEVGGLPVVAGFLFGILIYIAFKVFVYDDVSNMFTLFAAISSLLIATIIGFVDDILGWKIGLRQYQKALLTFAIALPIMVINAGNSIMNFPFIGEMNFGLLYPLLLIPLGIMVTSNAFNMLAGYNGLEAGMGVIILLTLSLISYLTGSFWVAMLGLCMAAALVAFLLYNWYPAELFPGDALTYSVGALIGIMAILANVEKFAVILFLLYIVQVFLKTRGLMQKESFAKCNKDGSLECRYDKIYGLEHLVIMVLKRFKKKAYEIEVVVVLLGAQVVLALSTLAYYFCC